MTKQENVNTIREDMMADLAEVLEYAISMIYSQKMCFFLSTWKFNDNNCIADYISNGEREDMLKALKETVKRFEKNEVMPRPIGEA